MLPERATGPISTFNYGWDTLGEEEAAAFWGTRGPEDIPQEFAKVEVKFPHPIIKRGLTV